ncbi:hypothetical protein Trydic_g4107 [Trypoxylus dichotomus]
MFINVKILVIVSTTIALLVTLLPRDTDGHILDTVPLVDGHNDLPYNLYNLLENNLESFRFDQNLTEDALFGKDNCRSCFTDLPRLRQGKVGAQFWVAYVSCQTQYKDALGKTIEQIDVIKRLVKKYSSDLEFVTTADGITEAFEKGKIGSLIGVEGGHSIDSRLGVLRMFYDMGVRYMTLTHSCNTPWADNSYVDDNVPILNLTDYGQMVVKEMNRLGMLVDLSHVSHAVMNKAIQVSRAPVIFSHSSAYTVFRHNRNVPDDTLDLVKENEGVVMVNFYDDFIRPNDAKASIVDVAAHINHIARRIGADYVGIGGDYDGVNKMPTGLEDVSKYPDLIDYLQNEDPDFWTDDNLKKLAGLNLIRVFKKAEEVRDSLIDEQPYQYWIPRADLDSVDDFGQDLKDDPLFGTSVCDVCHTDLPMLRKGKVGAQFWAAYVSCDTQYVDALAKTVEQIDVIKRLVNKYSSDLEFVTTASDCGIKTVSSARSSMLTREFVCTYVFELCGRLPRGAFTKPTTTTTSATRGQLKRTDPIGSNQGSRIRSRPQNRPQIGNDRIRICTAFRHPSHPIQAVRVMFSQIIIS